jgi:hypothetical protein
MTTNAPATPITPPRRPGYRERLLRSIPMFVRTASVFAPHSALAAAADTRGPVVNWPGEWDGPMPGKRRRIARAREWQDAHERWSRQLSRGLSQEVRSAILASRDPSLSLVAAIEYRQLARTLALQVLAEDQAVLSELTGYAEDQATMLVSERRLRLGALLALATGRHGGRARLARAAMADMHGDPISHGGTPRILAHAPPEEIERFADEVQSEARRILEYELDRLIATNPSSIAPQPYP